MRPRHRYVPSIDALPVRLAPCCMPVLSTSVDLLTTTSNTSCSDTTTTTVDTTTLGGGATVSG